MSELADLVTTAVAIAALVFSLANYVEARETRIRWRLDRVAGDKVESLTALLINESQRFAAEVLSISDPDASEKTTRAVVQPASR